MKQTISWFLVFMIVFSCASLLRGLGPAKEEPWENPYVDVTQDLWSYQYITELNKAGVLPSSEKFQGDQLEARGPLVLYLYNMDNGVFKDRQKQRKKDRKLKEIQTPGFTDIASDAAYYDAVCWAYTYGLIGGTSETTFSPDDALTREQVCTVMARFAALEEITLLSRTSSRTPSTSTTTPAAA